MSEPTTEIVFRDYVHSYQVAKDPQVGAVLANRFKSELRPEQSTHHIVAFEAYRGEDGDYIDAMHALAGLVMVVRELDDNLLLARVVKPNNDTDLPDEVSDLLVEQAERFANLTTNGIIALPSHVPELVPTLQDRGYDLRQGPFSEAVLYKRV